MGKLTAAIKALFNSKKTTSSSPAPISTYAAALLNKSDASAAGYMELPDFAKELAKVIFGQGAIITSGTSLNTISVPGCYYSPSGAVTSSLEYCPINAGGFYMIVINTYGPTSSNGFFQFLVSFSGVFYRDYSSEGWKKWQKFTTVAQSV